MSRLIARTETSSPSGPLGGGVGGHVAPPPHVPARGLASGLTVATPPHIPAATRVIPARLGDRLGIQHLILAFALTAVGIFATLPAWKDIFSIATVDPEYSHIFTVPLISLWLVYVRRARIRRTRPTGQFVGCAFVALGFIASTIGFYNGVQSLWHGGAVLIAVGCLVAALGKNVLLNFFPAVLVFAFLIPVPGTIRQPVALLLQHWTASTTQAILDASGFDVATFGNTVSINGTVLTVAEACNGVRLIFALGLVCYAFAFAMPLRNSLRVMILLLSPAAALFCNIVRTVPTTLVYGYCSSKVAGAFHDYSGWAMLPLAFFLLYVLIRTLRWAHIPVQRFTLASQ